MLLSHREREFLAVFIHEATTDPFKGPATEELHRRDIYYTDLGHLMAAYYRETAAEPVGLGGRNAQMPPCPWKDREAAERRNEEIEAALERAGNQPVS
jgi:hypothetical protein